LTVATNIKMPSLQATVHSLRENVPSLTILVVIKQ